VQTMTHKQGSLLFRFTRLKFWEPETAPAPTITEASAIIDSCMIWERAERGHEQEQAKRQVIRLVNKFFPDWTGDSLGNRPYGHGPRQQVMDFDTKPKATPRKPEEAPKATPAPTPKAKAPEATPEPTPAPAPAPAPEDEDSNEDKTIKELKRRIGAGLRNFWLAGPAGTGKTTLCRELAQALDLPCTILSCNSGTSPSEILGHKFPAPRTSPVSQAIAQAGIIVFDEITMLDAGVAAVANALLANGELETSTGHVTRHEDCTIISTANTLGDGADRVYIGNNQLDGSTMDRFVGGVLEVNYSTTYEARFNPEVVRYVQGLRTFADKAGLRRILSTRSIIAGHKLAAAGIDWKSAILATWTPTERAAAAKAGF
jgi:MoxR-like ATPase